MENLINQFETIQIVDEQINYQHYNFLCKCKEKFSSFTEFKLHLQTQHNCQNLRLAYLTAVKTILTEELSSFEHSLVRIGAVRVNFLLRYAMLI